MLILLFGIVLHLQALKSNFTLQTLTLRHNDIGVSGLLALGFALDHNNSLRRLEMWGNNFDDEAGRLYFDLARLRFPYIGLSVDVEVYVVDGVHMFAEK